MPNRRFDWHEHVKEVEGEFRAARMALDLLLTQAAFAPHLPVRDKKARRYLRAASENLEGTYLVRLFAAFEAALRSFDRAKHNDPSRDESASILIDTIGGRRGQGISSTIREGAHAVRRVRNYWAHESADLSDPMTLAQARAALERFLSWLPEEWG
jgi:hypothetical protein